MKSNTKNWMKRIQVAVTASIVLGMLVTMVSMHENYPFAPYTMYAYNHDITKLQFYRFFCKVGEKEISITKAMIAPMDEARLDTSINTSYINDEFEELKNKLTEIRKVIVRNSFSCDQAILKVVKYKTTEDYLKNVSDIQMTFEGNR